MNKLNQLYRKAPVIESPKSLDERVLKAARTQVPSFAAESDPDSTSQPGSKSQHGSPRSSRWWGVGYAVSYLGIFAIGLGILLEAGFFPLGREVSHDVGGTTAADLGNDTAGLHAEKSMPESITLAAEESSVQSRKSAPLMIDKAGLTVDASTSESADSKASAVTSPSASAASNSTAAELSIAMSAPDQRLSEREQQPSAPELLPSEPGEFVKPPAVATTDAINQNTFDSVAESAADMAPGVDTTLAPQVESNAVDEDLPEYLDIPENSGISEDLPGWLKQQLRESQSLVTPRSGDWLLLQPSENYTIQIAADTTASRLADLGNRLSIATELVRVSSSEGWYLLHGSFHTRQQAELVFSEILAGDLPINPQDSNIKLKAVSFAELHNALK